MLQHWCGPQSLPAAVADELPSYCGVVVCSANSVLLSGKCGKSACDCLANLRGVRGSEYAESHNVPASHNLSDPVSYGAFQSPIARGPIEIAIKNSMLVWIDFQKQAIPMKETSDDNFTLEGVRDVSIQASRETDGKINRLLVRQRSGVFLFDRVGSFTPPMSTEELMKRVIDAIGGEQNLRRPHSVEKRFRSITRRRESSAA